MSTSAIVVIVLAATGLLLAIAAIRIVREYERVIVFRLGLTNDNVTIRVEAAAGTGANGSAAVTSAPVIAAGTRGAA